MRLNDADIEKDKSNGSEIRKRFFSATGKIKINEFPPLNAFFETKNSVCVFFTQKSNYEKASKQVIEKSLN